MSSDKLDDPDDLDLEEISMAKSTKSTAKQAPYLRGPIPWWWLQQAVARGGSALATGLAVWHLRSLNRNLTFKASLGLLRKYTGLSEKATRDGLHRLEAGGLLTATRPAGQSPTITLKAHLHTSI